MCHNGIFILFVFTDEILGAGYDIGVAIICVIYKIKNDFDSYDRNIVTHSNNYFICHGNQI